VPLWPARVCVCVCFQGIPTIKVLAPLWPATLTQPGVICVVGASLDGFLRHTCEVTLPWQCCRSAHWRLRQCSICLSLPTSHHWPIGCCLCMARLASSDCITSARLMVSELRVCVCVCGLKPQLNQAATATNSGSLRLTRN